MESEAITVLYSAAAGAVYSVYVYLTKTSEEEFKVCKFGRTLVMGVFSGVVLYLSGQEVTVGAVESFSYPVGLTVLFDNLFKKVGLRCK